VPVGMHLHTLEPYAANFFQQQYKPDTQLLPQPTHWFFYVMLFVTKTLCSTFIFKRQKKIKELQANTPNKKTRHKKTAKLY
jgi:hypothetical protein